MLTSPEDVYIFLQMFSFQIDRVKRRSLEWAQIQYNWCPYRKGDFGHRDSHLQREDSVKTQGEHLLQAKDRLRL